MKNKKLDFSNISIIIPVKNNQKGIENLLDSFFNTQKLDNYPKELIIVDNNSFPKISIPSKFKNLGIQIQLIKCMNTGPAAARNMGAKIAKGNWLLFSDSDCIYTKTTIEGYLSCKEVGIAYAGKVLPLMSNLISNYYYRINLLNPPPSEHNKNQPSHIITANCLVNKTAFENVNGFNEEFKLASGEDVDLGLRLAKTGNIIFASNSIIKHDYKNNILDFYNRFVRYGKGLKQLEKFHNINISIDKITPKNQLGISFFLTLLLKIAVKKGKRNS